MDVDNVCPELGDRGGEAASQREKSSEGHVSDPTCWIVSVISPVLWIVDMPL